MGVVVGEPQNLEKDPQVMQILVLLATDIKVTVVVNMFKKKKK